MKDHKSRAMNLSLNNIHELNNVTTETVLGKHFSDSKKNFELSNNINDISVIKDVKSKHYSDTISDEVLKTILNYSSDIITILSKDGTIIYESDSISKVLGYTKIELIGKNAFSYVHKEDVAGVFSKFKTGLNNPGTSIILSFRFLRSDGSYAYLESSGAYSGTPDNNVVIISRDVSFRIVNENQITKLTTAIEQSSNTVVITDVNGNIEYANKKFTDLTGYDVEAVIGKNPKLLGSGKTPDEVYKDMWTTILTGKVWQGEFRNKKKSGELYWERNKITPVVDKNDRITNFISISDDITYEKLINERLEDNLREKEIMLKEIHHRVKNNLQIVISLLNLQSNSVDDLKLKNQLQISQNRVRSMALIHQLLYRSADLSGINMGEYLLSLSSQLLASYTDMRDFVSVKINTNDILFSIETAVPFGLMVNELMTNSMKHGFPRGRKGKIEITLKKTGADTFELNYFDNGIGIPITVVNGHVLSFGMYLIEMLVSQLDGNIVLVPSEGANYKINFQGSNYKSRFIYPN